MGDFDAYQSMVERAEHKPTAPRRAPWRRPRRCWPYIWAAAWIVIAACSAAAVAGVWLSKLIV